MARQRRGEARPIGIWLMRVRRGCSVVAEGATKPWLALPLIADAEQQPFGDGSAGRDASRFVIAKASDRLG
jgi:hypothetical protein